MSQSRRSIQRTLLQVVFIIPALIGLVFFFAVVSVRELSRSQSDFARVMGQLQETADLITSLEAVNTSALDQGRMSPELSQLYKRIGESLKEIHGFLPEKDAPLVYYRTLSAMFDHYRTESKSLIEHDVPADRIIEGRTFLRGLYSFMVRHVQQLAISVMSIETKRQTEQTLAANQSMIRSFILVFAVEFAGLVIIILLVRRIYATIHHVADYAGGLARKEWDLPDIEHYGYEDLRPVVDAFNEMKHSIVTHIAEMEEKHRLEAELNRQSLTLLEQRKLLRESQLFALQSQMNPHFLFNTLNVIAKTAQQKRSDETVELIQAMSEILRFNLQNLHRLVPLRDELESVRAYILIQQRRFAEGLSISMEVDDDVPQDILVPPMIIQPLIENAIQHGLNGKLFNRCLWGRIFCDGPERVGIGIEDNGSGIAEDLLKTLNQFADGGDTFAEVEKIGLRSVIRRINLAFGSAGGVRIESEPGVFTRITLSLPTSLPELPGGTGNV